MRSLIQIMIPILFVYRFRIKNLLKDQKTVKINEISNSTYNSYIIFIQIPY